MPFSAGPTPDLSSDIWITLSWPGLSLAGGAAELVLSVVGGLEIVVVSLVSTLLGKGGSDPVVSGELIAPEVDKLAVEVVSARFRLVAVEVVSVGFVSLEEVEGTDVVAG